MNIRRRGGVLFAGALAACLCTTGATAQAATTTTAGAAVPTVAPSSGQAYEIFPPYIDPTALKCLDVPSAATRPGVALQLFSCHGYASNGANQLWYFRPAGTFNGAAAYWIQNKNSTRCLDINVLQPEYGAITQQYCAYTADQLWEVSSPDESDHVNLISLAWGWCMAASDASGNNHTPVILGPCDPGPVWDQNQYTTWQLG
jgi:hypothetical protein